MIQSIRQREKSQIRLQFGRRLRAFPVDAVGDPFQNDIRPNHGQIAFVELPQVGFHLPDMLLAFIQKPIAVRSRFGFGAGAFIRHHCQFAPGGILRQFSPELLQTGKIVVCGHAPEQFPALRHRQFRGCGAIRSLRALRQQLQEFIHLFE
ncbi:hypothetical protein SDC9_142621 [bioreactor metagenome]|uniref:Uncharacterized protein n=1 Tax=bioreactor metagenome TaxID=1076179 RepID=A0A645E1B8_9ZZZZ